MTDAELTRLWRNTERFAEATVGLCLVLAVCAVLYAWPKWTAFVVVLPLLVVSSVAHIARVHVLRGMMDRRGLDWEAPIWWVR